MTLNGLAVDAPVYLDFAHDWLDPDTRSLLVQERHEFEAVLGAPVVFTEPPIACTRWVAERTSRGEAPSLAWDPDGATLRSRASDPDGLLATFSLLQTLAHTSGTCVYASPAQTVDQAVERIRSECLNSYPSFDLRGLDLSLKHN